MLGLLRPYTSFLLPSKIVSTSTKSSNVVMLSKYFYKPASTQQSRSKLASDINCNTKADRLTRESIPKHVAIILDGNRRWHKEHNKPISYVPFFQANLLFVDLCLKWGIPTASSFVYGIATLGREKEANDLMFQQLERWVKENLNVFSRKGVRLCVTGETSMLEESVQHTLKQVEAATNNNTKLEFILGVCYEGRNDIVQATKIICNKVRAGEMEPDLIDESIIEQHLSTRNSKNPNPDLLIRTGGDTLVSNYLMWQLAHTELYFTDIYAPEFSEGEFNKALRWFQRRERAFDK